MNDEQFKFNITRDLTKALTKLDKLEKCFSNHLNHHWAVTVIALGSFLSLLAGISLMLLRHYFTTGQWPF